MSLITRQGKGSKLSIQEMDNNLLYLESLSGNTGFTQAKIGSDTDYSSFDPDGSLRFYGSATTFTDAAVDILTEVAGTGNPLTARMFRNSGSISENYAIITSLGKYGTFLASGYTELKTALINQIFSVSFWFKSSTASGTKVMFSIPDSGNTGSIATFAIGLFGTKVYIQHNSTSNFSSNSINTDTWFHICYTQAGNIGKIYLNNILTTFTVSSTITDVVVNSGFWGCARNTGSLISPFPGSLSNLRFYNVLLVPDQVSELYNGGQGLNVDSHPFGILDLTEVLFNFKNLESGGTYLVNSSELGIGKDITLISTPLFEQGPINRGTNGVFLPSFECPCLNPGIVGDQRSIRFEMNHNWKTGSPINIHMHTSINEIILSGKTLVFNLEYTIQDIYAVLSTNSLNVINSGKTFPATSAITYTFTATHDIPAYSNLILEFGNIDMSQYTSVSTCGIMTITREIGTFSGSIFEVQSIRMHYEIDSTGSRSRYAK